MDAFLHDKTVQNFSIVTASFFRDFNNRHLNIVISEEDKKSLKDEKKATTKTGKDPPSQKKEDGASTMAAPPRSPRSGSRRQGAGFKPAMTATPDLTADNVNEVDGKEMKVPEGLY